ncbi:MAG: hypothetical protein QF756_07130, partial [Dehalococcoidia bacterium]|nr:hypothetical protein [Dehalococcoidia bacterium]
MGERKAYSKAIFLSVARTPLLILVSIISVFAHFVTFATSFSFIPIYAREIGGSESQIGYISTAMFAGGVLGTIAAPYIARRIEYPRAVLLGLG